MKRKDITDYEPLSLANMQAALDCRPREAGYIGPTRVGLGILC